MKVEFSRMFRPGALGGEGRRQRLEATPEERAALAGRMGLLELDSLSGELELVPAAGGTVRARGTLRAAVVQSCVVTLEPVPQTIEESLDWRILPPGKEPSEDLDEGPDEIESEPDGTVDLGEALAQSLALALDPYPRAPDAELPGDARDAASSPFSALRGLKPG
ncbi:YceD family protein [Pararoseomonas sp. SCSIO 73927]|uniref:YceD family protein n=1 Tax=Pararoseomonas sp. SCSIO 73927 TaxID=3114537 RepID=UPI0030CDCC09